MLIFPLEQVTYKGPERDNLWLAWLQPFNNYTHHHYSYSNCTTTL